MSSAFSSSLSPFPSSSSSSSSSASASPSPSSSVSSISPSHSLSNIIAANAAAHESHTNTNASASADPESSLALLAHSSASAGSIQPPMNSSDFPASAADYSQSKSRKSVHKDKQKHNESESRRRSRLRSQFLQLREAARSNKKDRFSILQSAIDRFGDLESKLKLLEKKKFEGKSSESTGGLSQLHMLAAIPCAFITLDGRFSDVNDAFLQLFGSTRENILSLTFFSVSLPSELIDTFAQLKSLLAGELSAYEGDKVCIAPNGILLPLHLTLTVAKRHNKAEHYIAFFVPKANKTLTNSSLQAVASQSIPLPVATQQISIPSPFPSHSMAMSAFPTYLLNNNQHQHHTQLSPAMQSHLMLRR